MAQIPNWSEKKLSYQDQTYWVSDNNPFNVAAGHFETRRLNPTSIVVNSGLRNYRTTPNFFSPTRPPLVPLGYEAEFIQQNANGYHKNNQRGIAYNQGSASPVEVVVDYRESFLVNQFNYSFLADVSTDADEIAKVRGKAAAKLLENLKDQSINVAQATVEREMTIQTVVSTAKTIAGVLTSLRRGSFSGAAKALGIVKPPKRGQRKFIKDYASDAANAAGNGWLALQYGWKPLINDVYGAAEALAKGNLDGSSRNRMYSHTSGRSTKSYDLRSKQFESLPSGYIGESSILRTRSARISCRYAVQCSRSSPNVQTMASLGVLNPLVLAWEVMPYSFVIDWFLPVGNWLNSLDATAGLSFEIGYFSTLTKCKLATIKMANYSFNSGYGTYYEVFEQYKQHDTMDRTRIFSFPSAPFPRFKNPVSSSHLTSAIALLNQLRK